MESYKLLLGLENNHSSSALFTSPSTSWTMSHITEVLIATIPADALPITARENKVFSSPVKPSKQSEDLPDVIPKTAPLTPVISSNAQNNSPVSNKSIHEGR